MNEDLVQFFTAIGISATLVFVGVWVYSLGRVLEDWFHRRVVRKALKKQGW